MNVFIPYSDTFKTAECLDNKRLNKQIIECNQMLKAIELSKLPYDKLPAWRNHPATKMYENNTEWLAWYRDVLILEQKFRKLPMSDMWWLADELELLRNSEPLRPCFIGNASLHMSHRARLYQKDSVHYNVFGRYNGFTQANWYVVNGIILKYINGKIVK